MSGVSWPTHKVKARAAQNLKLWKKARNRKLRRLNAGKRGDVTYV